MENNFVNENKKKTIPWVEKYRPTQFDEIVLDPYNRCIFNKILEMNYFPNLLFYGPPGTGKTTTIINLIQEYQTKYNRKNKSMIIHLNASDERGIDIIRNQINQFVKSKNLFETGLKFVILDEVDYMTKNAQQALKYLLQMSTYNVRFFLICNYISKIDESLQNEFICIRFNQLPEQDVFKFIKNIAVAEKFQLTDDAIKTIQTIYKSDIRSIINFIQLNQNTNIENWGKNIIHSAVYENMQSMLKNKRNSIPKIIQYLHELSIQYNIDKKNIIQNYFNYIIRNHPEMVTVSFLDIVENVVHNYDTKIDYLLIYFCSHLQKIFSSTKSKK
jgi:replication factor C subunit 3/5